MESNWYYRKDGSETGPVSTADVQELLRNGALSTTDFVRSDDGSWRPAGTCFDTVPVAAPTVPPRFPPPLPIARLGAGKPIWPFVAAAAGMFLLLAITVLSLAVDGGNEGGTAPENFPSIAAGNQPAGTLAISGTDATEELSQVVARMSERQLTAIGAFQLPPGQDLYGARVLISNQTDNWVHVRPENIRLHLNGDSVGVIAVQDPRFLQPAMLQPGQYVEGLVVYRAYAKAGAAMRLGQGTISYSNDPIR